MKRLLLIILAALAVLLLGYSIAEEGYFAPNEARIMFVGDIFLDRYIRQVSEKKGQDFIFECISGLLSEPDLVIGNLEGPVTDNPSRSVGSVPGSADNFVFTFPTTTAKLLYKYNIKLVSLGNNHISNFGREGIEQTKRHLAKARVKYFGGIAGDEPIYRTSKSGIDLAFISYNQFGGDSVDKVALKIKKEREDFPKSKIIVYAHWGEEYVEPTLQVRNTARKFAKAGADAIIGSHPHVVQYDERVGSTTVYYSLGNFIFDQYWDESVSTGLALELTITDHEIKAIEHPVVLHRTGQTCPK